MKILYNTLKQLIPGLTAAPREVGHRLTMNGFMMDGFEEVGKGDECDQIISLEVRQNRPDCLGVLGVAHEVAAAYGLKVKLPAAKVKIGIGRAPARVDAKESVRRAKVCRIDGVHNGPSPAWLKNFVEYSGMNSVNLLVDISNYGMLMTGIPNHLMDAAKMHGDLSWGHNMRFSSMLTLAGTELKLKKNGEVLLHDDKNPIGTLMVGSRATEVDGKTRALVVEVAVYDPVQVRTDSRAYSVVTEASRRGEKNLSTESLPYAFDFLVATILSLAGGKIATRIFEHYPNAKSFLPKQIVFDAALPARVAGIEISERAVEKILRHLRFSVHKSRGAWRVAPPADRTDIKIAEDVVEEVIRMYGYEKISGNSEPALVPLEDISSRALTTAETIRDMLVPLELHEVKLLPLTTDEINKKTNFEAWEAVRTQNSLNEEFPVMRQSILASLIPQTEVYARKNISGIRIFEIGKVFGKRKHSYVEHHACGILWEGGGRKNEQSLVEAQGILEKLFSRMEIGALSYRKTNVVPTVFEPGALWEVVAQNRAVGVIGVLKPVQISGNSFLKHVSYVELNIDAVVEARGKEVHYEARELLGKIVVLDQNIEVATREESEKILNAVSRSIGKKHFWNVEVVDAFQLPSGATRLTLRVSYENLSDDEAKKLHARVFAQISAQ